VNKSAGANGPYNPVITGTGSAVPSKTLTNEDFTKIVNTSDEWITTRTGIKVRHVAGEGETTATLSAEAARKALAAADLDAEDVELIIVATVTPEMVFPSTACFVQDMIGAKNAWAFDLAAACSGFVYGLSIVQQFIHAGRYRNALVIGAETLTRITDYDDRASCVLFGDGAGAVVVEASQEGPLGIIYSTSASDGSAWSSLTCEAYGSRYPVGKPLDDPKKTLMYINGREVYQLAIRRIVEIVNDCLDHCDSGTIDARQISHPNLTPGHAGTGIAGGDNGISLVMRSHSRHNGNRAFPFFPQGLYRRLIHTDNLWCVNNSDRVVGGIAQCQLLFDTILHADQDKLIIGVKHFICFQRALNNFIGCVVATHSVNCDTHCQPAASLPSFNVIFGFTNPQLSQAA